MGHKLAAIAALLALLVGFSSPVQANLASARYPNTVSGPYFWEVTANVENPQDGAKYAFGMFTNCQVYHRSYHTFFGTTVNGGGLNDSLNGTASLGCHISTGAWYNLAVQGFNYWTPSFYGTRRTYYLPSSSGTTITVPGGLNVSEGGSSMSSNTYPYTQGINVFDDNYFTCCENGQGC